MQKSALTSLADCYTWSLADVDGDGDVDNADAQYIAEYVAGVISVFPIEL